LDQEILSCLFPLARLDSQIAELNALEPCFIELSKRPETAKTACEKIGEKFDKVRCELSQMTNREWGKETALQTAYGHAQDVVRRAFKADMLIRGFPSF
jgi:hypothetical protein